ncbi:MAG: ATP-binding cassette domain-containing protein [Cyclobacteriaceae bacterium]
MSEKLLKAIIQLLVIVAKEEGVVEEAEKASVRDFLQENVSREDYASYLRVLDQYIEEISTGTDDKGEIQKLANDINKALTRPQKLVIMVRSMELIMADQKITDREKELLYFLGECFFFDKSVVDGIKTFVTAKVKEDYSSEYSIVVSTEDLNQKSDLKHIKLENLRGHIAFFRVPGIEIYFFKYAGGELLTLDGLLISPGKIKILPNGSSVKGKRTDRLYFSDILTAYREEVNETKISFAAEGISYEFRNGKKGLVDVNISESSGKLFGLMGGSGAGKSTLLNVLNGTSKPSAGAVRINGVDIYKNPKQVEGVIGFVPQDDLLIEDLTVFQNLYFAAKLCFSRAAKSELGALVDKTIDSLGLTEAKDLKVGNPLQKTISGGQRKRLNIGLELLREPSVLFVDEPTSGLSSRDSENIMDLLKELSLRGKMVFVVIHQPSSDIFKMFDKLVILDIGGHQIYYGNPVESVTYFKKIVDMIDKEQGACIECGNVNPEQIFNIIETKVVDEYGKVTNKRKYSPEQWHEHFQAGTVVPKEKEESEKPEQNLSIPSRVKQAKIFLTRDLLSKVSNRQYMIINVLEAPVLAFLLAIITKYSSSGSGYTFYGNENIPVFFFMSIIVALFMGLTVSAEEIIKDRRILKRETFLHLSRFSYLSSKTLILFALSALQTLLFILVGSLILEIQGMTMSYWLILFSVSCFANILGLNISSGFNSVITIYILIPLLIIPQLILSGVVVDFDKLNNTFSNEKKVPLIGELMASRWAYEAIAVTQFKDNPHNAQFYELDRVIAQNTYKSIYYIKFLQDNLTWCEKNQDNPLFDQKIELIRKEIQKELAVFGVDKFPNVDKLKKEEFSKPVFEEAKQFLSTLQGVYNNRRRTAKTELDTKIADLTSTDEKNAIFYDMKSRYQNDRINYMLKNIGTKKRIVESNGELVQKIYPIYAKNTEPSHPFDFRVNFYYPEKHFLGSYIDTKFFNVLIIWSMTILLFVALYYDWLRKIVGGRE